MECAQDFAYADEEEADGEIIDMFSSDSIQDPNNSTGSFPFNARPQMAKRQVGKIDTNIVEINLNCLKQDVEVATGEPIFCSNCNSVFNSFSKYTRQDQNVL